MPNTPIAELPRRTVSAHLEADVTEVAEVVISVALAAGSDAAETMDITLNGSPLRWDVVTAPHGTRLHLVRGIPAGRLVVDYRAEVSGAASVATPDADADAVDRITYLRCRRIQSPPPPGRAHPGFQLRT